VSASYTKKQTLAGDNIQHSPISFTWVFQFLYPLMLLRCTIHKFACPSSLNS